MVARAHGRGLLATTWVRNQFREALPDVPAMVAPAGSCLDPRRRRLAHRVARSLAPHSQRRPEGAPKIPDPDVGSPPGRLVEPSHLSAPLKAQSTSDHSYSWTSLPPLNLPSIDTHWVGGLQWVTG